ncbi:sulfotransferase [Hyphococcus sp. DH-69]|uniref:tetratricopeptide repeat-containing sulfotransferase family protein n=1 Tax=Hyphococcus formosus TaxID=3143534 RepID=UPI00398ACA2E
MAEYERIFQITKIDSDNKRQLLQAMVAQESGQYLDAIKIYRAILDVSPRNQDALHHFGMAMYKLNRVAEARQLLQASLFVDNDQPSVHMNLARICFNDKSFDEAERHLDEVARLGAEESDARILRGRCFAARSLHVEAAEQFLSVLENNPDDLDVALRLADSYDKSGKLQDAIMYYDYILQRDPTDRKARINYVLLLRRIGRLNDSLQRCEEGLVNSPTDVELMHNQAALYEELGEFEQAHAGYLKVLERAPQNGIALGSLVRMRRPKPTEDILGRAKKFVNDESAQEFEKVFVLYSLGSYFDSNKDYPSAYLYYSQANERQAQRTKYDRRKIEHFVSNQIADNTPDNLGILSSIDIAEDYCPIFILGMPRSGTTLTEQIISSHSKVFGCGEVDFFVKSFGFGDKPDLMRRYFDKNGKHSTHSLTALRNRYIDHIKNVFGEHKVFTDKMPFNFLYTGLIRTIFPEAKVIHCVRHPIDVCLSCYFQNLTGNHGFSMSLENAAHYYLSYYKIMSHYKDLLGETLVTLRYDTLVTDFESESKRLISSCGLQWEEACSEFYNTDRAVMTPSNWQVRQPIYRSSLERRNNYAPYLKILDEALAVPIQEFENGRGIYGDIE